MNHNIQIPFHQLLLATTEKESTIEFREQLVQRINNKEFSSEDFRNAYNYFRQRYLRENNNAKVQYCFGWLVARRKNKELAYELCKSAAKQGLPVAQHLLFLLNRNENENEIQYLQSAAKNGLEEAQHQLGHYYLKRKEMKDSFLWFEKAANSTKKVACFQYDLARCYYYGWGCDIDSKKSIELFKISADLGCIDSLFHLGHLLKDIKYFEKAAEKNHAPSQYNLASYLYSVKPKESLKWLMRSSENGFIEALLGMGKLFKFGNRNIGLKMNKEKAFEYFYWAGEKDVGRAKLELATCYENGIGTEKSLLKSYVNYRAIDHVKNANRIQNENGFYLELQNIIQENTRLKTKEKLLKFYKYFHFQIDILDLIVSFL